MTIAIRHFTVEVTPPVGIYLCKGLNGRSTGIETPIYLRAAILDSAGQRVVLVALDFTMICGNSHRQIRQCIADAAQTDVDRVVVQTVHQHDVPGIDADVHNVLADYADQVHDEVFWSQVLQDTSNACAQAILEPPQIVASMKTAEAAVDDFASNRRLIIDGKLSMRFSKCQSEALKSEPIGNIDPLLRQTAFYNEQDQLILTLNTYATHPQVADRRGLISDDAPGFAVRRMQELYPGAMHMYFTGCGANITNGKFAGPDSTKDISIFGNKLVAAMDACLRNGQRMDMEEIQWQYACESFPLRNDDLTEQELKQTLQASEEVLPQKYYLAKRIFIKQQAMRAYPFSVSKMTIGKLHWYFLPAEMFIEYQQYLTQKHEHETVMVAAYGDAFIAYVPTAKDFTVGGYEIGSCWLANDCEEHINGLLEQF